MTGSGEPLAVREVGRARRTEKLTARECALACGALGTLDVGVLGTLGDRLCGGFSLRHSLRGACPLSMPNNSRSTLGVAVLGAQYARAPFAPHGKGRGLFDLMWDNDMGLIHPRVRKRGFNWKASSVINEH